MMKNSFSYYIAIIVLTLFSLTSCIEVGNDENDIQVIDYQQQKESVEKANRYLLVKESEDINDYIERHGLSVERTGTGLAYSIIKQGNGLPIKRKDIVSMEYEVRLLNGNVLYSSKQDGIKTFVAGKGGVESGLEEAVVNMHHGDVAEIIIPSHLAHGLIGDGNKVPPKAALIYRVKIL